MSEAWASAHLVNALRPGGVTHGPREGKNYSLYISIFDSDSTCEGQIKTQCGPRKKPTWQPLVKTELSNLA